MSTTIRCPSCNSSTTALGRVEVFNRDQNDTRTGIAVVVEGPGPSVHVGRSMVFNPSEHGNGLRVAFLCEDPHCLPFEVTLVQQEQQTRLYLESVRV